MELNRTRHPLFSSSDLKLLLEREIDLYELQKKETHPTYLLVMDPLLTL
jgi:hypothetical protein